MNNQNYFKTISVALVSGTLFFLIGWFLLANIFAGNFVLPQSLHIGNFELQYYGLILAVAALAGYFLAMHRRKEFGIESSEADKIIFYVIVAGFVGARLYHVISEIGFYANEPAKIFAIWNGGLSIYGVVIGGIVVLLLYKIFHSKDSVNISQKMSLWTLLDWLIPSVALGQIIGRFGNFFNYEIYGYATSLPWKMFVPPQFRDSTLRLNEFFHPLFLYEATGSVIILYLLLKIKLRPGALFLVWLFLYNVMRFFLEQLRVGSVIYGDIRVNALFSLVLILLSITLYVKYVKPSSQNS